MLEHNERRYKLGSGAHDFGGCRSFFINFLFSVDAQMSNKANLISLYVAGDITDIPLKSGAYYIGAAVTGKPIESECLANIIADGTTAMIYIYEGSIVHRRFGTNGLWQPWTRESTTESAELVLLNGWKYADNYFGYQPKIYKCGNVVTVTGVITGGVKDIFTQICIIPPAFAPKVNVYQRLLCNDNASFGVLISTNGVVDIRTLVTAINVHFNFNYGI